MTTLFVLTSAAGRIWQRISRAAPARDALGLVVTLRLGYAAMAFLAWFLYPKSAGDFVPNYTAANWPLLYNRLLGLWHHWDGNNYIAIARDGYQARPDLIVFPPLYPWLVGVLGRLLGASYAVAGLLISTLAAWAAIMLLRELARREFGQAVADRSVIYLVAFPTAFFLFAVYSESLFLALLLGVFWAARYQRRWWLAGCLAALAALTRSLGVFLVLPLAWEWLTYQRLQLMARQADDQQAQGRAGIPTVAGVPAVALLRALARPAALAMVLPVAALGGWMLAQSLWLKLPLTAMVDAQANWGRHSAWPWTALREALRVLVAPGPNGLPVISVDWYQVNNLVDISFLFLALPLFGYACWLSWRRRFPLSFVLLAAAGLVLPLNAPVEFQPLLSYPRFVLVLFPLLIVLAGLSLRWRWFYRLSLGVSIGVHALLFARFCNFFWVA